MKKMSWRKKNKVDRQIDIYTRVLTSCCCAGSGEKGFIKDIKRDKCVRKVDGHMHKNKSTYRLLLCK